MKNSAFYRDHLHLKPHPEGGFYTETYRSSGVIPASASSQFKSDRNYSTAIYYLLEQGDFSAFHRIKSDECWHYYAGDTLLIHVLQNDGIYARIKLGPSTDEGEIFQFVVPANTWFAAECAEESSFVLTGCTVAPGFDFADFDIATKELLLDDFPEHSSIIIKLCR